VTSVAPCRALSRKYAVTLVGCGHTLDGVCSVFVDISFPLTTRRVARVAPLVLAVVIQTSVVAVLDITQLPCRDILRGSREAHGARVARLTASVRGYARA
jgi:hypothetical protein